jgi:hypothetical protein
MPSDDILDLIGRYSTGSLTPEEQKRLFAAAVDDQDLFDQLVREHDLKQLLDEPGVRDRMIRALEPPRRKTAWIFGVAATAALSAALMVVLLRPAPKPPPQVADAKIPPSTQVSQPETAPQPVATPTPAPEPAPQPAAVPTETRRAEASEPKTVTPVSQASTDAPLRDALKKEKDQPAPAAPPVPALPRQSSARMQVQAIQPLASQQQNAPGGPRQNNTDQTRNGVVNGAAAKAQDAAAAAFGFHYSTETQGHLSIIPAVDGYLFIKSNDGAVLFGPKLSAAGIIVDIPLAGGVTSAVITFSENSSPVSTTPVTRTDPNGSAEGAGSLAIQVKIKPQN